MFRTWSGECQCPLLARHLNGWNRLRYFQYCPLDGVTCEFVAYWKTSRSSMGRMVRYCRSPLSRWNGIVTLAVGLRQTSRAVHGSTGASVDMSALVSVGLKCHNMR